MAGVDFGVPASYAGDQDELDADYMCPVDWTSDNDEDNNGHVSAFGYVSACISKSARAAAGALMNSVSSVSRAVTASSRRTINLHPDSEQPAVLKKEDRRTVRKMLSTKSAFITLHMLGMVTAAAFPLKTRANRVRNVVAVQTCARAKGVQTKKAQGGADASVPASDEDDKGI